MMSNRVAPGPARRLRGWDNSDSVPTFSGRGDYQVSVGDRPLTRWGQTKQGIRDIGKNLVPDGTFANFGGAAGGSLGGYLGGSPGGIAGMGIGAYLGSKFSQLVGFGDYQIKANSLVDLPMGSQLAAFGNMELGTIVRHREYIRDVVVPAAPGSFANITFALNPGLSGSFPWLATIAGQYQEYQWMGCVFEFRSTSSETATGLALGSVVMASNYDTAEAAYVDKREMENSQYCVSAKPNVTFHHPIECDPSVSSVRVKYVRNGAVPAGKDARLYDHCNVNIATVGLPTGTSGNLGELWVSYEVALYKPILGGALAAMDHFQFTPSAGNRLGVNWATTTPLGGFYEGIGVVLSSSNAFQLPIGTPAGRYGCQIHISGSTSATIAAGFNLALSSGLTVLSDFGFGAATQEPEAYNGTIGFFNGDTLWFQINNQTSVLETVTFTAGDMPGGTLLGDLIVYRLPNHQT